MTPQPQHQKLELTNSPLGIVMKRMGLQIGMDTGVNLNKLIQKKPKSDPSVDNLSAAPVTPMPTIRYMSSRPRKPLKKNE
jgi:hypothetical protein